VLPASESSIIERHLRAQGIDLRLGEELAHIVPDAQRQVAGIKTKSGEEISCEFVGLAVGVSPNIGFLSGTALETDKGILVDECLRTNIEDVYAIGDCAQHRHPAAGRKSVEQVWYTGRMMGETVAKSVLGTPTPYSPGIWFNSAKFFDIEYQTYGQVPSVFPEGTRSIYWEHAQGQKCMHLVYEASSFRVLGINLLGIRHRHEVWDSWLSQGKSLQYVLAHLHEANFDPEFFRRHEHELLAVYNAQYPSMPIAPPARSWWSQLWNR
jgi:pyruvate/2-oxoglutarate dehydrogenase complex dihydrolipoamide dehydrogenase (E3) component